MREVIRPILEINPVTIDELSPMQADFVRHYVELGGQKGSGEKAALMAGYAPSGARVRASELKRNPKVRACIDEMLMTKLKDGVCLAVQVLYDLARNAPPSVRLSAAKELLDRGIGPVPSRSTQQQGETLEDILFLLDEEEHNAQLLEGTAVQANRMPSGNGSVAAGSKGGFADKLSKCADQYASSESKYIEKC